MSIKDFRGQVKISDVQTAFDEIIGRINNTVDIYNAAAEAEDIDYTKGSPKLSAASYTLTIGGLKTILNGYNNTLIGCNIFKIDDTTCLVTDGLYITSNEVYRIRSRFISGQSGWDLSEMYYDIDNDTVMFKDGVSQSVVEVTSGWSQPVISSNTECGVFTANYNSQNAYQITNSTGWSCSWAGTGAYAYPAFSWTLPKAIKITNISLDANSVVFNGSSTIVIECDNQEVYRGASGLISVPLSGRETSTIRIYEIISGNIIGFSTTFKNLLVTGNATSYAIDNGGTVTPSDNIIKICDLNWNGKDGLIKDNKKLKLENIKDYKLCSVSRKNTYAEGKWAEESLNTANAGKFVCYTADMTAGGSPYYGSVNILGKNIIENSPPNDAAHRSHSYIMCYTKLYVPKGASDLMTVDNRAGRLVSDSYLKKM